MADDQPVCQNDKNFLLNQVSSILIHPSLSYAIHKSYNFPKPSIYSMSPPKSLCCRALAKEREKVILFGHNPKNLNLFPHSSETFSCILNPTLNQPFHVLNLYEGPSISLPCPIIHNLTLSSNLS